MQLLPFCTHGYTLNVTTPVSYDGCTMKHTNTLPRTVTKIIGMIFLFAVLLYAFASTTHAAPKNTGGAVLQLTDSAAIFLIQFTLGSKNGDLLVPATTLRSTDDELDTSYTHYYIEDQTGDIVEDGTASAILLSDAPLDGTRYRVPEGETAVFTLLTLFVTDEEDPAFRARMRTLPFHVEDHLMNQQYNRHELKTFVSQSAALNVD